MASTPSFTLDTPAADLFDLPRAASDCTIVVAMSGGVDSSVVAALAAASGAKVIGITLQLYDYGAATGRTGACCAGDDIRDARAVADRLGFAHYVFDHESAFREEVIDQFADDYLAGRTPVPCIRCNMGPKFTDLLRMAKELGADCLATGHYVQRVQTAHGPQLHRATDPARDQSYFLYATTEDQLDFLRFPLGGMPKTETRILAEKMGLEVADKPDSQDICFVPQGKYADIIAKLRPDAGTPGDIVHIDGRVLGQHEGIMNFTIGQRRGIGIAAGEPLYVVSINAKSATVTVGPREALETRRILLRDINWLGDGSLEALEGAPLDLHVRVRSTRPPQPATLVLENGEPVVTLADGEDGISPGQACVFYADGEDRTRVLGGGWIARTENDLSSAKVNLFNANEARTKAIATVANA